MSVSSKPSSVGIVKTCKGRFTEFHFEERSRDSSSVAPILASLSNGRQELSVLPPPSPNAEGTQGTEMSSLPLGNALGGYISDSVFDVQEGKCDSFLNAVPNAPLGVTGENRHHNIGTNSGVQAGIVKKLGVNNSLGPRHIQLTTTSAMSLCVSAKCAAVQEELQMGVLDGKEIEVSFDHFPYYLR